jgi:S1-C subfamily serine protease
MSIRRHQRDYAGLRPGDVIDEVNRQPVSSVWDYQRALRALGKRAVVLGVNRQGVNRLSRCRARLFLDSR